MRLGGSRWAERIVQSEAIRLWIDVTPDVLVFLAIRLIDVTIYTMVTTNSFIYATADVIGAMVDVSSVTFHVIIASIKNRVVKDDSDFQTFLFSPTAFGSLETSRGQTPRGQRPG